MTTPTLTPLDPERERMADAGHLEEGLDGASPWYLWGPYLAERAWGSVREDYSADGDAWAYFPHDHARSRAYRWNEDGMAGLSDVFGRLCLGLALWNGRDPILKERMFGLDQQRGQSRRGRQGLLVVPRRAADRAPGCAGATTTRRPNSRTRSSSRVNRERSKLEPRVRAARHRRVRRRPLLDRRGRLREGRSDRHPDAGHGHATPAPTTDTLHVLPTLWFRNTWSWGDGTPRPSIIATDQGRSLFATHTELGDYALDVGAGPGRQPAPAAVLRERDQPGTPVRPAADHGLPEGRHQRPRGQRCRHGRPRRRNEGGGLVPGHAGAWRERRDPAPTPTDRRARRQ